MAILYTDKILLLHAGGITVDPKRLSERELEKLTRKLVQVGCVLKFSTPLLDHCRKATWSLLYLKCPEKSTNIILSHTKPKRTRHDIHLTILSIRSRPCKFLLCDCLSLSVSICLYSVSRIHLVKNLLQVQCNKNTSQVVMHSSLSSAMVKQEVLQAKTMHTTHIFLKAKPCCAAISVKLWYCLADFQIAQYQKCKPDAEFELKM